jgi:hypothetical protein
MPNKPLALAHHIKMTNRQGVILMRIPKIRNYTSDIDETTIELEELEAPRAFYNFGNKKDRNKFIKTCEILIRQSVEYKDLIDYLRTKMGMNFCSFFHNVSREAFNKTRFGIEIHHGPFTLYDIAAIVLHSHEMLEGEFKQHELLDIAEEVMELHYRGYVGLVPLSTTVHELVHSGKLFVPLQFIDDGFLKFYELYKDAIMDMEGLADLLDANVALSKEFEEDPDHFMSILQKKYIYVINEGYDNIPDKIVI